MHGVLRGFATGLLSLRPLMAATERHVRRRENRSRRLTRTEQLTARASAAALAAREPVPGAIIDFRSVTKLYQGGDIGIDGVTFAVHPGEFVFVVGASGSGKSTTIRLLIKEAEPTSGSISVAGRDLSTIPRRRVPYYRRNIGVVFQDYKLLPDRTVYDNVAYALQVTGSGRREIREKVPDILRLTGLATKLHNRPGQLSGGEQQRVSVARAFVNHPPLLLADEPTGNLDPETSIGIMQLLYRINRTGTTVVVATHDNAMVDRMRRRVIELAEGSVVRDEQTGLYSMRETTGEFAARLRVATPGVGLAGPDAPDPTARRLYPPEPPVEEA
jgi:cell division transport system ATP-binding protein